MYIYICVSIDPCLHTCVPPSPSLSPSLSLSFFLCLYLFHFTSNLLIAMSYIHTIRSTYVCKPCTTNLLRLKHMCIHTTCNLFCLGTRSPFRPSFFSTFFEWPSHIYWQSLPQPQCLGDVPMHMKMFTCLCHKTSSPSSSTSDRNRHCHNSCTTA